MMPNAAVVWSVTARAVVGVNAALSRRQREHGESIVVVIVGRGTAREAPRELEKTENLIGASLTGCLGNHCATSAQ